MSLYALRGDLLWERSFVVTWLAQGNVGKKDLCLFCVYGSPGTCAEYVTSALPAVNINNTLPETAHNFRIFFNQLPCFYSPYYV